MNDNELLESLRRIYEIREKFIKTNFDRSLPFGDAILDNRWSRAYRLGFGKGASIYDSSLVFGNVSVGKNTWIGSSVILDGSGGGITIGDFCSIAAGVHIYTHDTVLWALSCGKVPRYQASVSIGDCSYIGAQSVILAGVTIGKNCVIGANSLVNRSVSSRTVVGGSPARVLGHVEEDDEGIPRIVIHSSPSNLGSTEK